ncbi:MAG: hydantoinase/oxoprolinase family protein [Deltaproteobacteria bacterium]|nr:hydantoinase/oxoprolinase family protein [Deltaproteobacteria bacterium]
MADKKYIVAQDAGGSMTDCFLVDMEGNFSTGKFITHPEAEKISYIGALNDAASKWKMTSKDIHPNALSCTYTGTSMINILLTQAGSNVGLLITRGYAHLPIIERGLTWIGHTYEDILHQQLHEHTPWLVQPENIREVTERISVGSYYMQHHSLPGTIIIPMNEKEVVQGINELLDNGVEIIACMTLASYANPVHENRMAEIANEIIKERGMEIPVVTSNEMCSVPNETERMKTLLIQCYIQETARKALVNVEDATKEEGYDKDLMTLLGYGAAATVRYPKLAEAVASGPTGGLLGGKFISDFLDRPNMLCWDLGCTTCDVGLIAGGLLPVNKSPEFAGHKVRMPMIAIDCLGAGCSHVVKADPDSGRITVGPESVKAQLGTLYEADVVTIGDIDMTLGYVNPDYYLGGTIEINPERAKNELIKQVAEPLGQDLYDVSSKILDLLHDKVVNHINGIMLSKGLNPAEFTLIVYGAAGPLHLWGLDREIQFQEVIVVPWSAVFSSFGVAAADYFHRYDNAVTFFLTPDMPEEARLMQGKALSDTWASLEERGYSELKAEGFAREDVYFRYGISCRYIGQLSNWEVPVDVSRADSLEELDKIIQAFEENYTNIYPSGARFPESGYQITEIYLEAAADKPKPVIHSYPLQGKESPKEAFKGQRKAYFDGEWIQFDTFEQDLLEAGNRIDGPAIIEHTQTTFLIPPQNYVELDEYKFMHYKRK